MSKSIIDEDRDDQVYYCPRCHFMDCSPACWYAERDREDEEQQAQEEAFQ